MLLVVPGEPLVITFTADQTGRYEIETHAIEATVARLSVR